MPASAPISWPAIALGLALLVAYWIWLWAFFGKLRPRIMEALGRRLGVKVEESMSLLDAGTYNVTSEQAPLRKHGAVWSADVAVTVAGTVGVAALVFVPAFLVADSGALLPLEARVTGRGATLSVAQPVAWGKGAREATARLTMTNTGRLALARCQARTADYRARDGYLNGSSAFVDLPTGASREVDLPLDAVRAPTAPIEIRIELECANERMAVVWTRLILPQTPGGPPAAMP
jgi:hypothetical protein